MTRINTVAPALLPTPWLMAEYRELPRIINKMADRGLLPKALPPSYRMGAGHVKFFYNKLHWLHQRHRDIRLALQERFPDTNFTIDTSEAYMECLGHSPGLCNPFLWEPDAADHAVCMARLAERWKGSMLEWQTFFETVAKHNGVDTAKFINAYIAREKE